MDIYTITEDKLDQLGFNLKKEASLHTCDMILEIINAIRSLSKKILNTVLAIAGIRTEKVLELGGKLNCIHKVIDEVIIFKTSIR